MPPSLQNQGNFQQSDVSESAETGFAEAGAMQEVLLPSPDSGMIVFSSSSRILHMNGPARSLMALFGASHEGWPQMGPESMPSILTEFCEEVLVQLRHRVKAQDWAQFEIRRICHMVTPPVLLTGFGVPSSTNCDIRLILTLTPMPSTHCAAEDPRYLQLPTDAQASVSNATS